MAGYVAQNIVVRIVVVVGLFFETGEKNCPASALVLIVL